MKTIKFIGRDNRYSNLMTEEGESICKIRRSCSPRGVYSIKNVDNQVYLYLEGNDEPVAVFAETIYYPTENYCGKGKLGYFELKPKSWRDFMGFFAL